MSLGSLMRLGVGGVGYSSKVLSYNPIAYWMLSEPVGGVAHELVNGWHGAYTGVTLGQPGIGDGRTCPLFDGANDFVDIYSVALAAAFNGAEGSLMAWYSYAGVWNNGLAPNMINVEGGIILNRVRIFKSAVGNNTGVRTGNNVSEWLPGALGAGTAWYHGVLTWSETADAAILYLNGGAPVSAATLGVYNGTPAFNQCCIGARTIAPLNPWHGYLAHSAIWDRPLTPAEVADLAVV